MKCWVYWIRLASHTDIFSQGYVGITTLGVKERFARHVSAATKSGRRQRICNAILSHGVDNLIVDTVLVAPKDYCQWFENLLRLTEKIGWNLSVGGSLPRAGMKNSPEHIAKVVAVNKGREQRPEVVEAMRVRAKQQFSFDGGWEHPYSNKQAWALAPDVYACPGIGRRGAHQKFNIPVDSISKVVTKIKSGWNPNEDAAYQKWLSDYKETLNGSQPT